MYILSLFKFPSSSYSKWNLASPCKLCFSCKWDLFTFHTSYIQGLEMSWVTSRTFFSSALEHSSFEVPAIKPCQLLSLLAVIIYRSPDHSPSQVLRIQISMQMIFQHSDLTVPWLFLLQWSCPLILPQPPTHADTPLDIAILSNCTPSKISNSDIIAFPNFLPHPL